MDVIWLFSEMNSKAEALTERVCELRDALRAACSTGHSSIRPSNAAQAGAMVDARMRQEALLIWDDEQPTSMIGVNPPVAGVVRIGPVYTPPQLRRRGYAGSAASRR